MWYWALNFIFALWVVSQARSRKMDKAFLWAIGTFLFMLIVIPFYFAKRSLKHGEEREGGPGVEHHQVLRYFLDTIHVCSQHTNLVYQR